MKGDVRHSAEVDVVVDSTNHSRNPNKTMDFQPYFS